MRHRISLRRFTDVLSEEIHAIGGEPKMLVIPSFLCVEFKSQLGLRFRLMEYSVKTDLTPDWKEVAKFNGSDAALLVVDYFAIVKLVIPVDIQIQFNNRIFIDSAHRKIEAHQESVYPTIYSLRKNLVINTGGLLVPAGCDVSKFLKSTIRIARKVRCTIKGIVAKRFPESAFRQASSLGNPSDSRSQFTRLDDGSCLYEVYLVQMNMLSHFEEHYKGYPAILFRWPEEEIIMDDNISEISKFLKARQLRYILVHKLMNFEISCYEE